MYRTVVENGNVCDKEATKAWQSPLWSVPRSEALLCKGECGLWFHRGCASVPPSHYKMLSNSEEPFVCLSCANLQLKQEIEQLKNEPKGVAEVRDRSVHCSRK